MKMMNSLLAGILSCLVFPNLSSAGAIPTTTSGVLKLVVYENGAQKIKLPAGLGQISIIDWYLSTVTSEGNQDLTKNGTLFNHITEAKCAEQKSEVVCTVLTLAQEFVPTANDAEKFCHGSDYGRGIKVFFAKNGSKLKFLRGENDVSMSGDGPCGAEWN